MLDLANEARKLRKRKVREAAGAIQGTLEELLKTSKSLGNTHDEVVDEAFEALYKGVTSFRKELGVIKAYRQDAQKIIER